MMTWGNISATPTALGDGDETPGSSSRYTLPGVTKREAIGHKLAEKSHSRERNKQVHALDRAKKSIFGRTPDRLGSVLGGSSRLTPAGRTLLAKSSSFSSRKTGSTPLVRTKRKGAAETPT